MSYIRLLAFTSLMTVLPLIVIGQPEGSLPLSSKSSDLPCVSALAINSPALLQELEKVFVNIGDYELPIIALETKGDSSFCYVSALIGTYAIQRNPPTTIIRVLNREALFYTGNESVAQLTVSCKQYLEKKYQEILHVDKLNKKLGHPLGSALGGGYDPVLVKMYVRGSKVIRIKNSSSFPFFNY